MASTDFVNLQCSSRPCLNRCDEFSNNMSLQDQKNSLFGKGPTPSPTHQPSNSLNSVNREFPKSSGAAAPKPKMGISPELKAKKIAEGRESEEKGKNFLKTSLFQWTPDYVAAASSFDSAAQSFRTAEEFDSAIRLYTQVI
jgi:hypothetical protein